MADKIKTSQNKNLKNRFRFVILNDETFEEKFALTLTRTNVWLFFSITAFTLVFFTASAIIYTPLKYFIPGFGDYNYRSQMLQLEFKTDSLRREMQGREVWLQNVMDIAAGRVDTSKPLKTNTSPTDKSDIKLSDLSNEEQELRQQVEDEDNFSLSAGAKKDDGTVDQVKQMHPMKPVEGSVTEEYNAKGEHFGIDVAAKADEPVKAMLDGKVISAAFTLETGYVITIQHATDLVSVYKHNSRLFKRTGDAVKAGEVIAIVGSTGELSSGPHLHFEIWYAGQSLNPRDYIVF
ncbi:MAG: M23 family metallopeptidase [Bacteroidetes bacterium]|nr:M23 family metallopeptidase [Bacteroidota bacterium]MBK8658557.1 M23 family metallopeptidase [Bacteroidota bacterium]